LAGILVIEDEPILARNICDSLQLEGHEAVAFGSGEEALDALATFRPDVVLVDYRLPGINGLEVLHRIGKSGSSAAVILMTAHAHVQTAVDAMKNGASDFLLKPLDLRDLHVVVQRVIKSQMANAELRYFRERELTGGTLNPIIGESKPMQQVRALVKRITATPALASKEPPSILLTGDTGTGKDLVARAIHSCGPRRDAQFVHVNCTAIPETLVESELFGHVKGAFSGANADKRGLFEVAEGGTLFLDEIGHMPLTLQAKLLNVLEHRAVRPIGGTRERRVNVHVVAATNRNLEDAIEAGEFRQDLYHRLRVLTIAMPALWERPEDVEALANHFLKHYSSYFNIPLVGFSRAALDAIRAYDWPGNVRELKHAIESAVLIADGPTLEPDHLNLRPPGVAPRVQVEIPSEHRTIRLDFGESSPKLDEIEYEIIRSALEFSNHNLSRAAGILGISRDAIRYRLERFRRNNERPP
jgi:DNA-binding NtrC family response regulator